MYRESEKDMSVYKFHGKISKDMDGYEAFQCTLRVDIAFL